MSSGPCLGRSYKPSTIRTYSEKLDAYVLPAVGAYRLSELRRREVQALADEMLGAGLAPSTVRNAIDRCARSTAARSSWTRSPSTRPRISTCPRRAGTAIGLPRQPRRRRSSTRFRRQSERPGRPRVTPAFGAVSCGPFDATTSTLGDPRSLWATRRSPKRSIAMATCSPEPATRREREWTRISRRSSRARRSSTRRAPLARRQCSC
jgi:hypothetical protein